MTPRKPQPKRTPTRRSPGRIVVAKPPAKDSKQVDPVHPPNRHAAELTIAALQGEGRLSIVDSARVAALRALANAVDADPSNASLWREYRAAEASLREVHDDDTDATQALLAGMSATVGDAKVGKTRNARAAGSRRR